VNGQAAPPTATLGIIPATVAAVPAVAIRFKQEHPSVIPFSPVIYHKQAFSARLASRKNPNQKSKAQCNGDHNKRIMPKGFLDIIESLFHF
jgi:hypothetical protein